MYGQPVTKKSELSSAQEFADNCSTIKTRLSRIPILDVTPARSENIWLPKAFAGEVVPFRATAFREGHDLIGTELVVTDPAGTTSRHRMSPMGPGTDRWERWLRLDSEGIWNFYIVAYTDDYATWLHGAEIKMAANQDRELVLAAGRELLERAAHERQRSARTRSLLTSTAALVADVSQDVTERFAAATNEQIRAAFASQPLTSLTSESSPHDIQVERTRSGVGSWYEFFPRSVGAKQRRNGAWASGTFRSAAKRLPAIGRMGFDVVYLPPIHPIGRTFRKGPDNSLQAGENDPGSPWAIGSAEGGHDAIHPELGSENDFRYFVRTAKKAGLEVALDLALQASPDHPWVTQHPEWFSHRPDGSIAYAENPPKKYQDIYPLNFDTDEPGLRAEILRIVHYWMSLGVRIFRVDNPHTKPANFWEWLIHTINNTDPDVVFLAEAFTRPAIVRTLAMVGFQQSYTYFTWRNTKDELEEFLGSLTQDTADFLRPNLFVNTPDILPPYLQFGGRAAFTIRATLAATAAPTWGVYSGFELYEAAAREASEEYSANEKYEFRPRDFDAAQSEGRSLAPYLTLLNMTRREHPALRQLRTLHIHHSDDDRVLVYSKHLAAEFTDTGVADTVIVVANLDPHTPVETLVHLDIAAFGYSAGDHFEVSDLLTGEHWIWGSDNYVRLDPSTRPVHILVVSPSQHQEGGIREH